MPDAELAGAVRVSMMMAPVFEHIEGNMLAECMRHRAAGRTGPVRYANGVTLHVPPPEVPDELVRLAMRADVPEQVHQRGCASGSPDPRDEAIVAMISALERELLFGEPPPGPPDGT